MNALLHEELRAHAALIRERWETLLRIEPVNTPLAHPETLVHLIPLALDDVLAAIAQVVLNPLPQPIARLRLPPCDCGHNPYRVFYTAGERAITEAFVLAEARLASHLRDEHDLAELVFVIRRMAHAEIDAFCGVCSHRGVARKCRHAATAPCGEGAGS